MRIDLVKATSIEGLIPWDLTLVGPDGKDYATRRPTVGELALLESLPKKSNAEATDAAQALMFADPKPETKDWPCDLMIVAITGYLSYFNAIAEKNFNCLAANLREAAKTQVTSGNSSSV